MQVLKYLAKDKTFWVFLAASVLMLIAAVIWSFIPYIVPVWLTIIGSRIGKAFAKDEADRKVAIAKQLEDHYKDEYYILMNENIDLKADLQQARDAFESVRSKVNQLQAKVDATNKIVKPKTVSTKPQGVTVDESIAVKIRHEPVLGYLCSCESCMIKVDEKQRQEAVERKKELDYVATSPLARQFVVHPAYEYHAECDCGNCQAKRYLIATVRPQWVLSATK